MTNDATTITPTKINLHQKSKLLEIGFSDGFEFNFPCEYLRVFSTAAEVKIAKQPVAGKALVNITNIEAQGNYALRLFFDDGHDTGIYSWKTLHDLATNYKQNWDNYLNNILKFNLDRDDKSSKKTNPEKNITVLYFMQLANIAETSSEKINLPTKINTVEDLLKYLRLRSETWEQVFTEEKVQVTVNKQFTESYTPIEDGDEIAIVPKAQ